MAPPSDEASDEDRLFVKDGLRHYRRTYSLREVHWGFGVGAALVAIAAWVAWRGAHPDPKLFSAEVGLLEGAAATSTERGALPKSLLSDDTGQGGQGWQGWKEERIGQFDKDNLYVKIDGRADFFLSFGFQRLYAGTLASDSGSTIDIEMYDMGSDANALGAYKGEKSADAQDTTDDGGMYRLERNALYLARGSYYVRLIGSDETPAMQDRLRAVRTVFSAEVKAEALPWGYGFFAAHMHLPPGKVSYLKEDAFSFAFARDVYSANVAETEDQSTEIFVVATADENAARQMAGQFAAGFLGYGKKAETVAGVTLVRDRYLDSRAGASAEGRFVVGVRNAPDAKVAAAKLAEVRAAVASMPEDLRNRAQPVAPAAEAEDDGGHDQAEAGKAQGAADEAKPEGADGEDAEP